MNSSPYNLERLTNQQNKVQVPELTQQTTHRPFSHFYGANDKSASLLEFAFLTVGQHLKMKREIRSNRILRAGAGNFHQNMKKLTFCQVQRSHIFASFISIRFNVAVLSGKMILENILKFLMTLFITLLLISLTQTVAYPEGFRRRYTGLGVQTMSPNY